LTPPAGATPCICSTDVATDDGGTGDAMDVALDDTVAAAVGAAATASPAEMPLALRKLLKSTPACNALNARGNNAELSIKDGVVALFTVEREKSSGSCNCGSDCVISPGGCW